MKKEKVVLVFTDLDCSMTPSNVLITEEERDWIKEMDSHLPANFKERFFECYESQRYEGTLEELTSDEFHRWEELSDPEKFSFWRAHALSENAAHFDPYFSNAGKLVLYIQENDIVITGMIEVDNYGIIEIDKKADTKS